jgi:hypothetical protein
MSTPNLKILNKLIKASLKLHFAYKYKKTSYSAQIGPYGLANAI